MGFSTTAPYKTSGQDGIYPVLLQKEWESLPYPICSIYGVSMSTWYIPQVWRKARVTFVPKPGKIDYTTAKAFCPISLTSFLLKRWEKLVDRYLRYGPLVDIPIHLRQHAFQAGKFTESALHHVVRRIEKALDGGEYALGVFDIQGAFGNAPIITSIKKTLHERRVIPAISNWIGSMIEQRTVCVGLTMIHIATQRGLPQGRGLSPTL